MSIDREIQLHQALVAVIAAASQQGLNIDYLCNQAFGGLIGNLDFRWVTSDDVPHAIAEIEKARDAVRSLWPDQFRH
ncbi:hypothetical protein [Pseudomonas akapageensis]|uniref:hypothetical protein n=1 Tax=Pseudomonas akapageensis TaxID=2609961 RepID=UPI001408957D|nr:hypothetical protein [Pseudomonas akapageensis]